jgi:hypothetical protein
MSKPIALLCILFSTATLFWSYLQAGYWMAASGFAILGLVWLATQQRQLAWFSSWALFIKSAAAAVGIWLGLSPILMAFAVLNGLLAWDLTAFHQRLCFAAPTDDTLTIERRHLIWLGLAAIIGFLLSTTAGVLDIQLSFFLTLLLAIIAVLGIVRLVSWLRQ